jgi:hypothetical protein
MHRPFFIVRSRVAYTFTGLILLAFVNGCSNDESDGSSKKSVDTSTPEKLARATLDTLVNNDRKKFEASLTPEKKEFIELLRDNLPEKIGPEKVSRDEVIKEQSDKFPKSIKGLLKAWDRLRNEGGKAGVDWKDAKFKSAEFKIRERDGIKNTTITCTFTSGGKTYQISIADVFLIKKRWLIIDNVSFMGRIGSGDNGKTDSGPFRQKTQSEKHHHTKEKTSE